jgi:hypothetical protein
MFASEYGWTADYVMNGLTGKQARGLLDALEARYARQADAAAEAGGSHSGGGNSTNPDVIVFDENMSDAQLSLLGINVVSPTPAPS